MNEELASLLQELESTTIESYSMDSLLQKEEVKKTPAFVSERQSKSVQRAFKE